MEARDLRVSDAEREYVGQLLQRAVGQGMLSLGEFSERMDTALAARTRGELNAVLYDLPGIRAVGEEPAAAPTAPAAPAYAAAAPQVIPPQNVIRAKMSSVTRKGVWHVPPTLRVENWLSDVTLDFTSAVMQSQVVDVTVDGFCGSINLIVPVEATVDLNGVDTVGGSATNKVRSGPQFGPLHLVVRGRVRFGSVTAKNPFGTGLKRLLG
ncbi:DUF1707 domain-containing protein [Rhodococcus sp. NPDC058532]|uniref:DUF1707 SHOCT-like domain-containing protein n=1 Tax=Rhodococcus sp. NPDC058532 TaxID=3346540 RepID=UPI0036576289